MLLQILVKNEGLVQVEITAEHLGTPAEGFEKPIVVQAGESTTIAVNPAYTVLINQVD